MASPLEPLFRDVAGSPCRLAPERCAEIKGICERHGIGICFDGADPNTLLHVNHDTNEIFFGVAFAERLWAYCYAYIQVIKMLGDEDKGKILDITNKPDWQVARRLLEWAHNGQVNGINVPWPDDLPRPLVVPPTSGREFEATQAFLCLSGWCLLHEIGHVVSGHGKEKARSNDEFEEREYEADDWASSWILSRWAEFKKDELVFVFRASGGAFALSIIASFEFYHRTYGGYKHPDPQERLLHFLDEFAPEGEGAEVTKNDKVWGASIAILLLHLENVGKRVPKVEYATLREVFLAIARELM